ncbi:E3 SUMO-protein ligase NSE2 [Trichoplax sp. H2]|nr:E3 SUMO-protein ligase NSE2 [Trichoplax sp. H2]|eukprot:RDD47570.1 E3 SUMO-protein ligase NSE2 [Trichoplax sp. H2]
MAGASEIMSTISEAIRTINEAADHTVKVAQSISYKKDTLLVNQFENTIFEYAKVDSQLKEWEKVIEGYSQTLSDYQMRIDNDQQRINPHQDIHETILQDCLDSANKATENNLRAHPFIRQYQDAGFTIEDDMNDDLVTTHVHRSTTCPITKQDFVDPVKNIHCGHTYSHAAIIEIMNLNQKSGKKNRCPVGGCNRFVNENDLEPDSAMQALIDKNQK